MMLAALWRKEDPRKAVANALRRANATLAVFEEALELSAKHMTSMAEIPLATGLDPSESLRQLEREQKKLVNGARKVRMELAAIEDDAKDWGFRAEQATGDGRVELAKAASLRRQELETDARQLQEELDEWDETVRWYERAMERLR